MHTLLWISCMKGIMTVKDLTSAYGNVIKMTPWVQQAIGKLNWSALWRIDLLRMMVSYHLGEGHTCIHGDFYGREDRNYSDTCFSRPLHHMEDARATHLPSRCNPDTHVPMIPAKFSIDNRIPRSVSPLPLSNVSDWLRISAPRSCLS